MRNSRLLDLQKFLKANRQWPRRLNVDHARMKLRTAPEQADFWRAALKAYGAR